MLWFFIPVICVKERKQKIKKDCELANIEKKGVTHRQCLFDRVFPFLAMPRCQNR